MSLYVGFNLVESLEETFLGVELNAFTQFTGVEISRRSNSWEHDIDICKAGIVQLDLLTLLYGVNQLLHVFLQYQELLDSHVFFSNYPPLQRVQPRVIQSLRLDQNLTPFLVLSHHIIDDFFATYLPKSIFFEILHHDFLNR